MYALEALMAFEGASPWNRTLHVLADQEMTLECPQCGEQLTISFESTPPMTTALDHDLPITPVTRADAAQLYGAAARIHTLAFNHGHGADARSLQSCKCCGLCPPRRSPTHGGISAERVLYELQCIVLAGQGRGRPLGLRVASLHQCIERVNLFGFHAIRDRLRAHVGAVDSTWTAQQALDALATLTEARASWPGFAAVEAAHRTALKRIGRRNVGPGAPLTRLAWLTTYLLGEQAWVWQTVDLGACPSCDHGGTS